MKQAAILYTLSNVGSRLARVRTRTWIFIGLGVVAVMAMLAWAAIAVLSWAWGQVPALAETGRQAAGAAMEKVGQVAPGLKTQLDPLLGEVGLGKAEAPAADVSGSDLPGVARYPGSVRTYFAREADRTELRYRGQAEMRAVLDHYTSRLTAAGYVHEVLSATPEAERHRFARAGDTLDFEIRKAGPDGGVEVVLVNKVI
jgi:hypothetical protein